MCAFLVLFFFLCSSLVRSFAHVYLYSRLRFIYCSVEFIFGFAYIICAKLNRFFFVRRAFASVWACVQYILVVCWFDHFVHIIRWACVLLSQCVCVYAFVCARSFLHSFLFISFVFLVCWAPYFALMTIIRCLFRHIIRSVFFFQLFVCMSWANRCSVLYYTFFSFGWIDACVCAANVNALLYKQLKLATTTTLPKTSNQSASCVWTNLERAERGKNARSKCRNSTIIATKLSNCISLILQSKWLFHSIAIRSAPIQINSNFRLRLVWKVIAFGYFSCDFLFRLFFRETNRQMLWAWSNEKYPEYVTLSMHRNSFCIWNQTISSFAV